MLATLPKCSPYRATVESLLALEDAVRLWQSSPTASVFNHPAWWQAAIDAYGEGRELLVASVRGEDSRLAAVWPFWRKRLGARDAFAEVIEPVGARQTDYVLPLVAAGERTEDAVVALLEAISPRLGPHALLFWPKSPLPEVSRRAVMRAFPRRTWRVHEQAMPTAYIPLGPTLEATQGRWKSHHRRELRRQERRLGEQGALALEVAADRTEAMRSLAVLMDMHRTGWAARGGRSELEDPRAVRFVERIVADLPFELVHLSTLSAGGRPASIQLGFTDDTSVMLYKPAFEQAFASFSPGKVHDSLLVRWAVERGLERIDFLQGLEAYKLTWTSTQRETVAFAIAPPTGVLAFAWNARWRELVIRYRE